MKNCSICKKEKDLDLFSRDKYKKDGRQAECKDCNAEYYDKNKKRYHEAYRKRYLANTEEFLKNNANRKYKHRYGITTEAKEKMIFEQDGKCLICQNAFQDTKDQNVDHNHETKKVRGILCNNCNKGLGLFQDNFELLVSASKYLLSYK
jgi:hypothetical protein